MTGDSFEYLPENLVVRAQLIAHGDFIFSGQTAANENLKSANFQTSRWLFNEGDLILKGQTIFDLKCGIREFYRRRESVIQMLSPLSGLATTAHLYCEALRGTKTKMMTPRRLTPWLKPFEQAAILTGGGELATKKNIFNIEAAVTKAMGGPKAVTQYFRQIETEFAIECVCKEDIFEAVKYGVTKIILNPENVALMDDVPAHIETIVSGSLALENLRPWVQAAVSFIQPEFLSTTTPRAEMEWSLEWD